MDAAFQVFDGAEVYIPPNQYVTTERYVAYVDYLADLSGPLQLHHDTQDSEVPYVFSETVAKDIQNVAGTVEFYSYPGDDHNLANSFGLAMSRTIAYFDKYLK